GAVAEGGVAALAPGADLLAASEATQRATSDAAREYALREPDLGDVAEHYGAALEEASGGPVVVDAVVEEVAHAAAEIGIQPGTVFAAELAERLDELGLARNGRPEPAPARTPSPFARIPVW